MYSNTYGENMKRTFLSFIIFLMFQLITEMSFLHSLLMLPNNVKCRQKDIKHYFNIPRKERYRLEKKNLKKGRRKDVGNYFLVF